ncbi:hypothetical protein DRQ50_06110 [bacterium]|nr:MAG: hypothetical protein DRQ50_06110 [bacterium]
MNVGLPHTGDHARAGRVLVTGGLLLLLVVITTGCATYSAKIADLRPELVAGDFESALQTVEDETGSKDRLLYFLERGIILHYADRWTESNVAFAAAERLSDELYTKSISEGAFSLISNDNAISYRARPFELAMVPYFRALNYIYLGQRNEALVEARRASLQMSKYVDTTLGSIRREDRGDLERIRNNAFLLYTSGMLYDWDGELNDAFTAYRNAAVAYQRNSGLLKLVPPPSLAADLARVSGRLGFKTELDELRRSCPDVFRAAAAAAGDQMVAWQPGQGTVVFFLESGFVSAKTQIRFDFPVFEGEAYNDNSYWAWQIYAGMGNTQALVAGRKIEYWVSVAAPEMQDSVGSVAVARVSAVPADSTARAAATVVPVAVSSRAENLSRQARITFDAEKPTIFFKTILRGLTKYLASRGAESAGGELAKWAATLFGAVTESADTRSWLTLPADVHLVRLNLPAGRWDLEVELTGHGGEPLGSQTVADVQVRAGDWTFLSRRLF